MKDETNNLSVVELIGRRLRDDIIKGHLAPGEQLVEVDLVQAYEVSRNSIREVLHLLVRDGLVTSIRHRGVFVRTFGVEDLHDIYTARRTIQLQAIRAAAYPEHLLDGMAKNVEKAKQAIERRNWREVGTLSLEFHQFIVAVLGSRLLDEFFLNICAQMRLIFSVGMNESIVQKPMWVDREACIHQFLVKGRQAQAEKSLAAYLDDSEAILSSIVRSHQGRG